jgi:hypothetical protein
MCIITNPLTSLILKKGFALGLTSVGTSLLLIGSSCTKSITKVGGEAGSAAIANQASPQGDGSLPVIKFKPEEMGDFDKNHHQPHVIRLSYDYSEKYLYIVDGAVLSDKQKTSMLKKLSAKKIKVESYQLIPASQMIELYGEKGANGAVIIRTKKG